MAFTTRTTAHPLVFQTSRKKLHSIHPPDECSTWWTQFRAPNSQESKRGATQRHSTAPFPPRGRCVADYEQIILEERTEDEAAARSIQRATVLQAMRSMRAMADLLTPSTLKAATRSNFPAECCKRL